MSPCRRRLRYHLRDHALTTPSAALVSTNLSVGRTARRPPDPFHALGPDRTPSLCTAPPDPERLAIASVKREFGTLADRRFGCTTASRSRILLKTTTLGWCPASSVVHRAGCAIEG